MVAEQKEFEGKDLEEALGAAASELRIPEDELHYEIVEQGRRGVFGLGARSVRIRILEPLENGDDESEAPEATPPAPEDSTEREISGEQAGEIENTVQRILDLMELKLRARGGFRQGELTVELEGPDQRLMLQKDSELLFALQFLLNRMARRRWPSLSRIHLSCDATQKRRDEELIELTREVALQVERTGNEKLLHPMNAYERRLVHLTVREFEGLISTSAGDGSLKRVKISKNT